MLPEQVEHTRHTLVKCWQSKRQTGWAWGYLQLQGLFVFSRNLHRDMRINGRIKLPAYNQDGWNHIIQIVNRFLCQWGLSRAPFEIFELYVGRWMFVFGLTQYLETCSKCGSVFVSQCVNLESQGERSALQSVCHSVIRPLGWHTISHTNTHIPFLPSVCKTHMYCMCPSLSSTNHIWKHPRHVHILLFSVYPHVQHRETHT